MLEAALLSLSLKFSRSKGGGKEKAATFVQVRECAHIHSLVVQVDGQDCKWAATRGWCAQQVASIF